MERPDGTLAPEDYAEPRCLLCEDPYGAAPKVKSIPQGRVIEKMDEYMARRDYDGARRHLEYWLEEARLGGDKRGELLVRNELVGHFRKTGDRDNALKNAEEALRLLKELDFEGTISSGTTYTNIATALNAFGENERSLEYFEKARGVYEAAPNTRGDLLGGLYNNMALVLATLGRFAEAYELYDKAMEIMGKEPGGELEQAITCLNRANALEAEKGMEKAEGAVFDLLDHALDLLDHTAHEKDGYYAFVCEKCAPTFSYYGYFFAADDLKRRAEEIYART